MKLLSILLLLSTIIGCNGKNQSKNEVVSQTQQIINDSIRESYIDSTTVGIKGLYKLELKSINGKDSIYADILFSEKINGKWNVKQHLIFEKDGVIGCDPEFKDFNNDGYNDFVYKSGVAARGANEIRTLFIFNPDKGELTHIKNSDNYPNLEYNKELDCIDSFAVYGGCTTHFLKLKNDSLKEFASVSIFDGLMEIHEVNSSGKEILIKQDSTTENYIRYKNYKPLIVNPDF